MTVGDLLLEIRYELGDTQKVKYSDYSLLNTVNSVLRIVNNTLSSMNSSLVIKKDTVTLINGEGELPSDFQGVVNVEGLSYAPHDANIDASTYQIMGNKICSQNNTITLKYKAMFSNVTQLTDQLPLSDGYSELIKKFTLALLLEKMSKEDIVFTQMVSDDIRKMLPGREISPYELQFSFRV